MNRFPERIEPQQLPPSIVELVDKSLDLPDNVRRYLQPVIDKVCEDATRRRKILATVQEALTQLRLDMKYLIFDLEATRRERDELREKNL